MRAYVCIHACTCVHMCVRFQARGQFECLPLSFSTLFFTRESANPELTNLARLAAQKAPRSICFSGGWFTDACCYVSYVGAGHLNSGPHAKQKSLYPQSRLSALRTLFLFRLALLEVSSFLRTEVEFCLHTPFEICEAIIIFKKLSIPGTMLETMK